MESDIENFELLFEMEDDCINEGNAPVYSLLSSIKNGPIAKRLCYSVWFLERKNKKLSYPFE